MAGSNVRLHRTSINVVDCKSNNKNIVSAHHQAECVDCANNLHHSWQAPKRHKTNAWLVKEQKFHNNQPYWWLANGHHWPVCPERCLIHKQCGGSLAQGSRHCSSCISRNTTTVDKAHSRCWSQADAGQHCDSTIQWFCRLWCKITSMVPGHNNKPCGPIVDCQEQRQHHHCVQPSSTLSVDRVEQHHQKDCSVVNLWE